MRKLLPLIGMAMVGGAYGQVFDVDTLLYNGTVDSHINVVVLSEGYQATEFGQFATHAQALVQTLLTTEPYTQYADHFNVFIVKVPSVQSGTDHPGTGFDVSEPAHPVVSVNTYFGTTFDYNGIHRLLYTSDYASVLSVLAANTPWYDTAVLLVNSPYYGGAGSGAFAAVSAHASSASIFIHELGHSFVNLADEYWPGDNYASERVNLTQQTSPALVKWTNWMGSAGIGIHQHCCTPIANTWYRPHQNCAMRVLGAPFCAVCKQAIVERIHSYTSPILSFTPGTPTFTYTAPFVASVDLLAPDPNTLRVRWKVNGVVQPSAATSLTIHAGSLVPGVNTVRVLIEDTTALLRVDDHGLLHGDSVTWSVSYTPAAQVISPRVFLSGAYPAGGGLMSDHMRSAGLLPLTEPYSLLGYSHVGGGGETALPATMALTGPDAIVDWVVVELRDPNGAAAVVATRSALLQRDGDVVSSDGTSPISFAVPGGNSFHIAIRHRNHLGAMTGTPLLLSAIPTVVDFTTPAMATYGTDAQEMIGSVRALWPGDANRDGMIEYVGDGNDRDLVLQAIGGVVPTNVLPNAYDLRDVTMDGLVKYAGDGNDRDRILQAIGGTIPTAVRTQQLP
jgi:hypothetical protein